MHILLVDDDPDVRTVATLSLRNVGGFSVTSASSGSDALKALRELTPDAILLDVMMPGLDGLSTLAQLRKQSALAEVPVIFMTAKVRARDLERYRTAGACGVIQKPFDPLSLAGEVRRILTDLRPSATR